MFPYGTFLLLKARGCGCWGNPHPARVLCRVPAATNLASVAMLAWNCGQDTGVAGDMLRWGVSHGQPLVGSPRRRGECRKSGICVELREWPSLAPLQGGGLCLSPLAQFLVKPLLIPEGRHLGESQRGTPPTWHGAFEVPHHGKSLASPSLQVERAT